MFLTRKKLKLFIESYLLEEEETETDSQKEETSVDDSKKFEIGDHTFVISVNSSTGVAVDIRKEGKENIKFEFSKDDDNTDPDGKKKDKLKNILAGVGKFVVKHSKGKDDYQTLIKSINEYFGETFLSKNLVQPHLVRFESEFGLIK